MRFSDILAEAATPVTIILILIALDVITGIIASLRKKNLNLTMLADFCLSNIIPYVGAFLLVDFVLNAIVTDSNWWIVWGVEMTMFLLIFTSLCGSVYRNVLEIWYAMENSKEAIERVFAEEEDEYTNFEDDGSS